MFNDVSVTAGMLISFENLFYFSYTVVVVISGFPFCLFLLIFGMFTSLHDCEGMALLAQRTW